MKRKKPVGFSVERLEGRLMLAGNVSASLRRGDLLIRGDGSDNQLEISHASPGMVHIEGADGTTINGFPSVELPSPSDDLRIRMQQGGEDSVTILGGVEVPDDLRARMGQGSFVIDGTLDPVEVGDDLWVRSHHDAAVTLRNQVNVEDNLNISTNGDAVVFAGLAGIADISEAEFDDSLNIDNPYWPLVPGTTYTYQENTLDEDTGELNTEDIIVEVLDETRTIMGIESRVVRDRVFAEGLLIEDTFDWFAQDNNGNVWYMGEDVTDFEYDDEGNLIGTSHPGAFEAGVDGAQAGVLVQADPVPGDRHYQEVSVGIAVDQAQVLSTSETVESVLGTHHNVLKSNETATIEPDAVDHKFFAPGVGQVLGHILDEQTNEILGTFELISLELNGVPVTQVVDTEGFDGSNPDFEPTGGVEIGGSTGVRSRGTVSFGGVFAEEDVRIRTSEDATVIDSILESDLQVIANEVLSIQNSDFEGETNVRGDLDFYSFGSTFFEQVSVRLGPSDNLLAIANSNFDELQANGRGGINTFEDLGGNEIDELSLWNFVEDDS